VDLGLAVVLEKLKSIFRGRGRPPVAPVDDPSAGAKTGDDERS